MRAIWILLRWPLRAWLHRRCLRRIAVLEHTLWPMEGPILGTTWAAFLYEQQSCFAAIKEKTEWVT